MLGHCETSPAPAAASWVPYCGSENPALVVPDTPTRGLVLSFLVRLV